MTDGTRSCYQCEKRHQGCHATCPDYQKENAEHLAKKAIITQKKAVRNGIYESRADKVARAIKRRQNGKSKKSNSK